MTRWPWHTRNAPPGGLASLLGGIAIRGKIAALAMMKAVTDLPYLRRTPTARFESLTGWSYPTYLLTGFAGLGSVSLRAVDLPRARQILGWRQFLARIRLDWRHGPPASVNLYVRRTVAESRNIALVESYYKSANGNETHAPYFAHPRFYEQKLHVLCRTYRGSDRPIRVFFAGTHADSAYTEQFGFEMLNRTEILSFVFDNFDVRSLADTRQGEIVMSITGVPGRDMRKHALNVLEYLQALGDSDFFLSPPGFRMPHSHNLIEAMSVGAIPILNYSDLVHPSLSPGHNCLVFNTLDELRTVLDQALTMSPEEIASMRQAVVSYYEHELDPVSFARRVLALDPSVDRLLVNAENGL